MYASISDGETYFATRLNTDAWDNAEDDDKTAALTMSTQAINMLNYFGELADEDQDDQFPRGDDTTVPTDIVYACLENALALLDGIDPELETEALRMVGMQYGSVRNTYDPDRMPLHFLHGISSGRAWQLIKPYLRDVNTINLNRV